ncbi:MAG: AbrB/MazE/SpoVT family DNA-binding domain-containing protein [Methylococcales bacterium]|nr:AbrB/MazE/SpoVT family DNA-binding domain-containing protein [Methylococcales bacterium]
METNIRKWGNSAGVVIPQNVLKECNLNIGDAVDITIDNGVIIIKPVPGTLSLEDIAKNILQLTKSLSNDDRKHLFSIIGIKE